MSGLSLILANWRWIGAGLLSVALFAGGVWVKGKFERAAEADRLEHRLESERMLREASDSLRIQMAKQLAIEQGKIHETVRTVIRKVPTLVRDDRACDLSAQLVGMLNDARTDVVPSP